MPQRSHFGHKRVKTENPQAGHFALTCLSMNVFDYNLCSSKASNDAQRLT